MWDPRTRPKALAPKTADSIVAVRMGDQQSAKGPENRAPTHYAINQMGKGARRGTASAASSSRRIIKRRSRAAGRAASAAKQVGKAVGKAVLAVVSPILAMGGGTVILVLLMAVILVAAIAASPFGILFANESGGPDTVPISAVVEQINNELEAKLEALREEASCDSAVVEGEPADWAEVLAVFAVKVAGANMDAVDVVTMDAGHIARLKTVFWDMTSITHRVEVIYHPGSGDADGWTEKNLYITISAKSAEEMKTKYHFNRNQVTALDELLEQRDLLLELIEDVSSVSGDMAALICDLQTDLSPEQEAVDRTVCSLVGKVNYFGGRKEPCDWLGCPMGRAAAGHGGRQLHHRNLPALRNGLQWIRRLGVLQSVWRKLYPAQSLYPHRLE